MPKKITFFQKKIVDRVANFAGPPTFQGYQVFWKTVPSKCISSYSFWTTGHKFHSYLPKWCVHNCYYRKNLLFAKQKFYKTIYVKNLQKKLKKNYVYIKIVAKIVWSYISIFLILTIVNRAY